MYLSFVIILYLLLATRTSVSITRFPFILSLSLGDIHLDIQRYPRSCYTDDPPLQTSHHSSSSSSSSLLHASTTAAAAVAANVQYVQIDEMNINVDADVDGNALCGAYFGNHLERNLSLLIL
jgi:hypothetical protein